MMMEQENVCLITCEQSIKLVNQLYLESKYQKVIRPDEERKMYCTLLQWVQVKLHQITSSTNVRHLTANESMNQLQKVILSAMQEMIMLTNKQCIEKGSLLRIFQQYLIKLIDNMSETMLNKIQKTNSEYVKKLEETESHYQSIINQIQEENKQLKSMKDQKWKNLYIVIKDNRILRRQKCKMIKVLHEERLKLQNLHQELIVLTKQNQMNKLIASYQTESDKKLQVFLKRRAALLKFQNFIQGYPKQAKKILNLQLQKLATQQRINLDDKVEFIIKTIIETKDIVDQYDYEDQFQIKKNKIIFNQSTQTYFEDVDYLEFRQKQLHPPKQIKPKLNFYHQTCQTIKPKLKMSSIIISEHFVNKLPKLKSSKYSFLRDFKKINEQETCNLTINLQIYNIEIKNDNTQKRSMKQFCLMRYQNILIDHAEILISQLPLNFQLTQDIAKSKEFVKKSSKNIQKRKNISAFALNLNSGSQQNLIRQNLNSTKQLRVNESKEGNINFSKIIESVKEQTKFQSKSTQEKSNFYQNSQRVSEISIKSRLSNSTISLLEKKTLPKKLEQITVINNNKIIEVEEQIESERTNKYLNLQEKENKSISKKLNHVLSLTAKQASESNNKFKRSLILNNTQISNNHPFHQENQNKLKKIQKTSRNKSNFLDLHLSKRQSSNSQEKFSEFNSSALKAKVLKSPQKMLYRHSTQGEEKLQISESIQENQIMIKQVVQEKAVHQNSFQQNQIQFKQINFMNGKQTSKIVEKMVKNIYLRRSQLLNKNLLLEQFVRNFLKNNFGVKHEFRINTHLINFNKDQNIMGVVFNLMLNESSDKQYLRDLFKIFIKMLSMTEGSLELISKPQTIRIFRYSLSFHFKNEDIEAIIGEFDYFSKKNSCVCEIFFLLEWQFRRYSVGSELYEVLRQILPDFQRNISYNELKQLMSITRYDPDYYENLLRLKMFKDQDISRHVLALYAQRYNWKSFTQLKHTINSRYQEIFGAFSEQHSIHFIQHHRSKDLPWLFHLFDQSLHNHHQFNIPLSNIQLKAIQIAITNNKIAMNFPMPADLISFNIESSKFKIRAELK